MTINRSCQHNFETKHLTQENPLLALPLEVLHQITEYVATGRSLQEARKNVVVWGRVSCLTHTLKQEPRIEFILSISLTIERLIRFRQRTGSEEGFATRNVQVAPLLSLPLEVLNKIVDYVATERGSIEAAVHTIRLERVSCLTYLTTRASVEAESAIMHAKYFKSVAIYICRSQLADFYQAVYGDELSSPEIVERVKQLKDRDLIYEMVWLESKEAAEREGRVLSDDGDPQWGENHVCDDRAIFCRALQRAVAEKFDKLSAEQKVVVQERVDGITRKFGEVRHRGENTLRLIDAMEKPPRNAWEALEEVDRMEGLWRG